MLGRIVIFLLVAILISSCDDGQQMLIATNVSQETANEITRQLLVNDVHSTQLQLKSGAFNVQVQQKDLSKSLRIMSYYGGIPREFGSLGTVFKKDSFISSPLEEHARYIYALQQEISELVSSIIGVVDVKTSVSIPQTYDGYSSDVIVQSPTASVYIRYLPSSYLITRKNQIKLLISKSIVGLTPDNVNVYMEEARALN